MYEAAAIVKLQLSVLNVSPSIFKMRIVILGASGHGKVVADICLKLNYTIIGFLDANIPAGTPILKDLTVIGKDSDLPELIHKYDIHHLAIAIGDNHIRSLISKKWMNLIPCPKLIHPSATIAEDTQIGTGTIICAGANVGPSSKIGDFCLLNTLSSLDHDGKMGDYSSLAPGSIIAGNVTIGEASAICMSANVAHKVTIGSESVIGAGALVLKNVPSNVVVYGVPAKIIRERKRSDHYL